MEWTVTCQLVRVTESRNLLLNAQCGFQCHNIDPATNHLMKFKCHSQHSFFMCLLHLVTVISDFKKLYITIRHCGILTFLWWTHESIAHFPLFLSLRLLILSSLFIIFNSIDCHKGQSVSGATFFSHLLYYDTFGPPVLTLSYAGDTFCWCYLMTL